MTKARNAKADPLLWCILLAIAYAAITTGGDKPLVWRTPSLIMVAAGLPAFGFAFAFGRLIWLLSRKRFATLAGVALLVLNYSWLLQSRIATPDMTMAGFAMIALWQFTAACQLPAKQARTRLVISGLCLGLAVSYRWSVLPVAILPGLAFLVIRLRYHGVFFLTRTDSGPVRGITFPEAALWLGLLPLIVYWASHLSGYFGDSPSINWFDPAGWPGGAIGWPDGMHTWHQYRSVWRGIVMAGNPVIMWAGLAGALWSLWAGVAQKRHDTLTLGILYLASIGWWIIVEKPTPFYGHFLLPAAFLSGCLALMLEALWHRRDVWRYLAPAILMGAAGVFLYSYPAISAGQ